MGQKSFFGTGPIPWRTFILFRIALTLYLALIAWQALTTYVIRCQR